MGLFDEIIVEYELPPCNDIVPEPGTVFQSKDFLCAMDHYKLTKNGVLLEADYDFSESVTRTINNKEITVPVREIVGYSKPYTGCTAGCHPLHGFFEIYTHIGDVRMLYYLKFTNGTLEKVEAVDEPCLNS